MNIAFVVRSVASLLPTYTTTHLAREAHRRGHAVFIVRARDLLLDQRGRSYARGIRAPRSFPTSTNDYLAALRSPAAFREALDMESLDVVCLRTNPHASESPSDPRFTAVALSIAEILRDRGVMVVNDPAGLLRAGSKLYLMALPEDVRPRTLVTTDERALKHFLRSLHGPAVLKPVAGYGGNSVFYVRRGEVANVNQYIAALRREGFVMAQEYLPGARRGDKRLLVLDGEPVTVDGAVAIYKRVHPRDDMRNNMHVGGKRKRATLTEAERATVRRIAPFLQADGIYLAGVDLVDGKVLEVNVWSPGGIHNCNELYGIDVARPIIDDLESRVAKRGSVVELPRDRAS